MKKLILAAAAFCCAIPAMAGDAYVGASAGKTHLDAHHSGYLLDGTGNPGAYKVFGGYQFTQGFGAEAGFADLGKVDFRSVLGPGDIKVRSWYAAGTGTLPLTESLSISGKLGIAATHTSLQGPQYASREVQNQPSLMTGVGLNYALTEKASLVAEYENFGKVAKKGVNVHADMLSVGLKMKF